MQCKCSLDNNYDVIGLCDIDEFNKKLSKFKENSWTELSLPETLYIKDSNPDIGDILEVYINIKIISTKILSTPSSITPNFEGFVLTGKTLSVHGHIRYKIIYRANSFTKNLHSHSFIEEFSSAIPLSPNTDPTIDKYCVYPCIENIFLKPISKKSMIKNLTLFLFAHKIPSSLGPIQKFLPNTIIVNSENNEEVLFIDFNTTNKKISINSTGIIPNPQSQTLFLVLTIYDNFGRIIKRGELNSNESADAFSKSLNNTDFKYGGAIQISCLDRQKVIVKNYPDSKTPKYILEDKIQRFTISKNGLEPYLYPNSIIINNDEEEMSKISLNFMPDKLLVSRTDNVTPREFDKNEEYFSFLLLSSKLEILDQAAIKGKETSENFSKILNNAPFNLESIIKLRYKKNSNIVITNYKDKEKYTPENNFEFFIIRNSSLIPLRLSFLPNIISLKNRNNSYIFTIAFISNPHKIIFDSKGVINQNSTFTFKIFNELGNIEKLKATFSVGKNPDDNLQRLDLREFKFNDILQIDYTDPTLVEITNFPNISTPIYHPTFNSQKFRITPQGLVEIPFSYLNEIRIEALQKFLGSVRFNFRNKVLDVSSTGTPIPIGENDTEFLSFVLMNSNFNIKAEGVINGSSNADDFEDSLDNVDISEDDIIKLRYRILGFNITNYKDQLSYLARGSFEFMKITPEKLTPLTPTFFDSNINFKNRDGEIVSSISFISNAKILNIIPGETNKDSTFTFTLLSSIQAVEFSKTIKPNENPDLMLSLDNKIFRFGDIIELRYTDNTLIEITNFPIKGARPYRPKGNSERFTLSPSGLINYIYPNRILINNLEKERIAEMSFDFVNKQVNILSTDSVASANYDGQEYVNISLLSPNLSLDATASLKGSETADDFNDNLNYKDFDEEYLIKLRYKDGANLSITNFNLSSEYSPKGTFEFLLIQKYCLKSINIEILPNLISLKNKNNTSIFNLGFIKNLKLLIMESTGVINVDSIFKFNLLDSNKKIKISTVFLKGQSADINLPFIDNMQFIFGDIVELEYTDNILVEISDLPNKGEIYTPKGTTESFVITEQGLEPLNKTQIQNYFNYEENYTTANNLLSQNNLLPQEDLPEESCLNENELSSQYQFLNQENYYQNEKYLTQDNLQHQEEQSSIYDDSKNQPNYQSEYLSNQEDSLTEENNIFRQNNLLNEDGLISKTDLPTKENNTLSQDDSLNQQQYYQEEHTLLEDNISKEENPLAEKKDYPNEIIVKPLSTNIANITFNADATSFIVKSTDNTIPEDESRLQILSVLLLRDNYTVKSLCDIKVSENASNLEGILNSAIIDTGDILKLRCKTESFIITNYKENKNYTVKDYFEFISITAKGLTPANITFLPNTITLLNESNEEILYIKLLLNAKIFAIIPTEYSNNNSKFTFKLFTSSKILKRSQVLNEDALPDIMLALDNTQFEIGDIIELSSYKKDLVTISNLNEENSLYTLENDFEQFQITEKGLIKL